MFKNYLRLAFRNIARNRFYAIINLAGLSIAAAFCLLVFWHVEYEYSFDKFHRNISQLYAVELRDLSHSSNQQERRESSFFSLLNTGMDQSSTTVTPPVMSLQMEKDLPEIEHAVRLINPSEEKVRVNNRSFAEKGNVAYVDRDFFVAFSFPLLQGNPSTVLNGHNNIVISEKAAEKYFGTTDALGKSIMFPNNDSSSFMVSGIVKSFPANSSFQFDLILPRTSSLDYDEDINNGLNTSKDHLFIKLRAGVNKNLFQQKLDTFAKYFFGTSFNQVNGKPVPDNYRIFLRPFANAHFIENSGLGHYTNIKNVYLLISITVVLLLIASLNYILLTLTETLSRSQEVGIRKTIGAQRKQVVLQFYTGTQVLTVIAVIIGFILAIICLPVFRKLTGTDLQIPFFSIKNIATVFLLAAVLGVLSGIYPAFVMSGLKPLNIMRKNSAYRLNPYLSRFLVIVQSSVCVTLIIATLVITKQMSFISKKDLGFDKEQVITVRNPYDDPQAGIQLKERLAHFASLEPSLGDFSGSFMGYYNTNNHLINDERVMIEAFDVDYNYFSFFKIPIMKGRDFLPGSVADSAILNLADGQYIKGSSRANQHVIVNETLYHLLGDPKLEEINPSLGGIIIGVCKDYYPDELTKKVAPSYHRIARNYIGLFSFRIKPNQDIPHVIDKIRTNWNHLTGNEPFSYTFLDEKLATNYEAYLRWMKTITASGILSLIIACLGLFGLSGLTATSRVKEIGIRKVFGASEGGLFLLLNKESFITTVISFLIALPFAYYVSNVWLENFAFRIKLTWSLFAISGLISMLTAIITVSYHTIKTARANPVKSLRSE